MHPLSPSLPCNLQTFSAVCFFKNFLLNGQFRITYQHGYLGCLPLLMELVFCNATQHIIFK